MEEGHGVRREDVMYNDFVIVGPPDDPAGIAGSTDAAAAFAQIAEVQAPFVSRGDDSGTHTKEKAIWSAAGIEPAGDWYISAGQGMGAVLTLADETQAYTLSDRATYLARTLEGTELVDRDRGRSDSVQPLWRDRGEPGEKPGNPGRVCEPVHRLAGLGADTGNHQPIRHGGVRSAAVHAGFGSLAQQVDGALAAGSIEPYTTHACAPAQRATRLAIVWQAG